MKFMKKLKKRIYYALQISLDTPLCISNGIGEMTDRDVLRSWDDIPFIPGTSFAGAFRAFEEECGNDITTLFGTADEAKGRMSTLWISDFYFDGDVLTAIRDGVHLEDKVAVAGAKFDYEIVEHGTGILYMQLQIWDDDNEAELREAVQRIAGGIHNGDIRLGSQKNRGLGRLRLNKVYYREFSAAQVDSWIAFHKEELLDEMYEQDINMWCLSRERFTTILLPLKLTGGLSIRQYSTKVNEPDFISLMRKTEDKQEMPVIPGSSWKGALRQRMVDIITDFGVKRQLEHEYKELFGYVQEGHYPAAKASDMMVSESTLYDSRYIRSTRNQVSRFENATVQGALFEERCAVGGNTVLEIKVKNENSADWFIAVLLLALKDLQKGYLSIGGGAAIGRGIFANAGEISISSGKTEADYMQALKLKIKEVVQA